MKRTAKYLSILFILVSCSVKNKPDRLQDQEIDKFLSQLNQNEQFNGGILVSKGNEILLKKAYGIADFETKRTLTENTVFQCASISKTFTATAVLQLANAGKLSFDDKLVDFFPNLPYPDITITHLLTHTSGLYPYNPLFAEKWDGSKIATNPDIIRMYENEKPELFFVPGTEFSYCNVGYVFLASIVEQVSKLNFDEYLKQNIFIPLEMSDTQIYTLLNEEKIEDFADEHVLDPLTGKYKTPTDAGYHNYVYYLHGKVGDDKVATTLDDLWKWNRAIFKDQYLGIQNSKLAFNAFNKNIPEEKMHSKFGCGYGFQLDSLETYGKLIYHNGGEPGLKARFHYYTDLDISIIMYSNAHIGYIRQVKDAVLAILTNQPYELPKKSIANEMAKVAYLGKDQLYGVLEKHVNDTIQYYLRESEVNSLAGTFWTQEMYDIGFDLLEINVEHFPESVGAVYTLGEGYMETGKMDEAIPYFKRAKKLMLERPVEKQNPRFIEAMNNLINQNED